MKFLLLFLFILGGCATTDISSLDPKSVATGATVVKTVEKIKEVFTPHYPLLNNPSEICDITSDPVTCYLVPCSEEGDCAVRIDKATFLENNPKIVTIRASQVVEIVKFCEKNPKACEEYSGHYEGQKIILRRN